jgi:FkbH-like protein
MYETEANTALADLSEIPQHAVREFRELTGKIISRTVLPWSEHCTECVWPTCYSTCDLYSPRLDGRCRRFVDGMVRVEDPAAANAYLLKISFKRWGKLWTPGNVRLSPPGQALRLEQRDHRIGTALHQLPLPAPIKQAVIAKRYNFKKRAAKEGSTGHVRPTCFLLECYNPQPHAVRLSLTMRPTSAGLLIPFQKLVNLAPNGFQRIRVPIEEVSRYIDVGAPFDIDVMPSDDTTDTTLYFGLMEFVLEAQQPPTKGKTIKCVVWDLDNTLWNGVLVEDGADFLSLKPDVVDVIKKLDERGILNSIASKNNFEDALRILKKFKIDEYFLCPQISWQPKSEGIHAITQQLNIGIDTVLFVDDSQFELEQVRATCPEVRVLDAKHYQTVVEMNECQVPVTAESVDRRKLYQLESKRQTVAQSFGDNYLAFLRDCQIELIIQPMREETLERVHELTQRTNQMNFSGNRYDRSVLRSILDSPNLDTFVLSCNDRFGTYGVIGFCIVDNREPRMTDLMFSCRIQSKRVEHAFLAYLIQKYVQNSRRDFTAEYRKTPRNAPAGRVFTDLGMDETETKDGVSLFVFRHDRQIPNDGVIQIVFRND